MQVSGGADVQGGVPLAPRTAHEWARQLTWWALALPAAMGVALATHSVYLLDYAHVMSGVLWTGADLFLGFILGPVMRRLTAQQRRAVITYLVPKTLLYMPAVAFTTGTAGWFLSNWMGLLAPASPDRNWVLAALVITTILAVQGFGIILPNNFRMLREMGSVEPNVDRIIRLNRVNLRLAGIQGALQVIIILVMAHLAVG
jgi:uncharacterized membrane protein